MGREGVKCWNRYPVEMKARLAKPRHPLASLRRRGMALLYDQADEVVDQYVKAFEKVWAHRSELAML